MSTHLPVTEPDDFSPQLAEALAALERLRVAWSEYLDAREAAVRPRHAERPAPARRARLAQGMLPSLPVAALEAARHNAAVLAAVAAATGPEVRHP
ncbi:hypothetical protein [Cellulosimicrobium sp. RS]|uniref:hypothetical protein n=1 Tax=Cellulosimicrobium sp. RS TaxID=3381347 RepID=UPI0038FC924C